MENGVIQIFTTTKDVGNKEGVNKYFIDGIENIDSVIDKLLFNGKDVIYVHLSCSIEYSELNMVLNNWCQTIKNKGLASHMTFQQMATPKNGSEFVFFFDDENKIKESRHLISFIK